MNTGFIIKLPSETDYVFGAKSGISFEEVNPSGNWTDYLPSAERQKFYYFDSMACVTYSALNALETQLNAFIALKRLTLAQMAFLNEYGCLDINGKANISDRYTAKISGTTKVGNYLQKVADSLRHDGILPEKDWTYSQEANSIFNWNDYYKEIPAILKDKAQEFYKHFEIQYEWVPNDLVSLKKNLRQAPLQIAAGICAGWSSSQIIQACERQPEHATEIFNLTDEFIEDFDSYPPYILRLAPDYKLPFVLKIIIKPITMTNVSLVSNGAEIGFFLPATNPEALKAMAMNYGINIPLEVDGSVNWSELEKQIKFILLGK